MQTLRKKTSPLKFFSDRNETTKFLGDGVSFKAKLIGILEVSEARGDRMCQEALSDLKMAIRAAGEHKQRITVNIAIDGLRLRDEKTGDCLYHHPVHKISFIAQDMTDSRAFGYIFGSPDTGHRFFGIKTDKAASQVRMTYVRGATTMKVVIAMRDLFQVVFSLKKKEIELAKQHLEKTYLPQSPLFSEASAPPLKVLEKSRSEMKGVPSTSDSKSSGTAVADLVDLELALNNLQQGLNQMEKITPSNPYGSKDDPFGDSFVCPPVSTQQPILPPPPSSGRERTRTTDSINIFSPKMPHRAGVSLDDSKESLPHSKEPKELKDHFTFPRELSASVTSTERSLSDDWFATADKFEEPLVPPEQINDDKHEQTKQEIMSQFDVFTELDPLGTGRSKPYIDKKYFFQELKNPPKKALNELVSSNAVNQEVFSSSGGGTINATGSANVFSADPFGEDPFVKDDPFADSDFSKQDPFHSEFLHFPTTHITNNWENKGPPPTNQMSRSPKLTPLDKESSSSVSPKSYFGNRSVEFTFDKKLHEKPTLDVSSGSESTPEPPPRPVSTLTETRPPPLPPKKHNDILVKPPPRPPYMEENRYDYVVGKSEPIHKEIVSEAEKGPPLPLPLRKSKFESDFIPYPDRPTKKLNTMSSDEDYLTPISFPEKPNKCDINISSSKSRVTKSTDSINNPIEGLDVSLSQLTLSGLNELATKLNIPSNQLSNMTLAQLASYISNFIKEKANEQEKLHEQSKSNEFPKFEADFSAFNNNNNTDSVNTVASTTSSTYDKYAVFRELQEEINQISKTEPQVESSVIEDKLDDNKFEDKFEDSVQELEVESSDVKNDVDSDDKYAALREIVEKEMHINNPKPDELVPSSSQEPSEDLKDSSITDDIETASNLNNAITPVKELRPIDSLGYSIDKSKSPNRSPSRSPILKSPRNPSIAKEIAASNRPTSGSLSDIVSGSSPEVDNTGSNSDNARKGTNTDLGESWAVFDSNAPPSESLKENLCAVQSEEGVSPWSSDSKEFGNGSPVEWRKKESGEQWKNKKDQDGWWDTSAEPEVVGFYNPANRRSTDSYEEEYYECYERPRRPRRQWQHGSHQPAGGHSSSSRDVSPWEEEPNRRDGWPRHSKASFDRHRDRRADSWDEDDDYEYEDENRPRGHYFERHASRDSERHSSGGSRDLDSERWAEGWTDERRHRRRREAGPRDMTDKDRWCCVDWKRDRPERDRPERDRPERERPERDRPERERPERERPERDRPERDRPERDSEKSRRYPRKLPSDRREERYRSPRESQESPWEDEYDPESRHYLSVGNRKNWKQRPSSASEMERKSAELKARGHLLGTGGSDGEKDRRYKGARRSRSRDSHYVEPPVRHKPETSSTRSQYRNKQHIHSRTLDFDYGEVGSKKQIPEGTGSLKKPTPTKLDRPKKTKDDSPKDCTSKGVLPSSLPRKNTDRSKSMFEADYEPTKDSPSPSQWEGGKFDFEVEFLLETGSVIAHKKDQLAMPGQWQPFPKPANLSQLTDEDLKPKSLSYKDHRSLSRQQISRSPFEDDFSPSEKTMEGNGISSIKEETDVAEDTEDDNRYASPKPPEPQRRTAPPKHRLSSSSGGRTNVNLSKSESVNIFSMENDPFDDEFFSQSPDETKGSGRGVDYNWTDHFKEYGTRRK